jgi:DNA-binding Lrp family transcriptional regulator
MPSRPTLARHSPSWAPWSACEPPRSTTASSASFTAELERLPEICEVHSVAGEETFVCKVVTSSTRHLDDLLARLKAMRGMARTRTTIVLSTPYDRGGVTVQTEAKA